MKRDKKKTMRDGKIKSRKEERRKKKEEEKERKRIDDK